MKLFALTAFISMASLADAAAITIPALTDGGAAQAGDAVPIVRNNTSYKAELGTAASKAASNAANPTVSSVSGTTTAGHIAAFSDALGTIQDGGAQIPSPTTWNNYAAYGDGVAIGSYLSPSQAYPNLLAADFGLTATINNDNGVFDCINADAKIFATSSPALQAAQLVTWLPGVLDATYGGSTLSVSHEQITDSCHKAALSWMAIPAQDKVFAQACTQAGTWANDTSYGGNYGVTSATNASTLSCPITTNGAPIYAWYRIHDNDGGTFTYSLDGGSPDSVPTNGGNAFSYPVDGTHYGVASIRIPATVGAHTVNFTVSSSTGSSNNVSIIGMGTAPGKPYYGMPSVFYGGQLYESSDALSASTAQYNADERADAATMQADGLSVNFVDVRKYVNSTSDMTGTGDQYTPNATGQAHIKDAFEAAIQFLKQNPPAVLNPKKYGAVCNTQYFDGRNGSGLVTMTAGSPVISIGSYTFTPTDVGKTISINAGGASAGVDTGTIVSIASNGSTATLSVTPTVSTTTGYAVFGHDDSAAFLAATVDSALLGMPVSMPTNCGVRHFTPANGSTITGLVNGTGYGYSPDVRPTLYILNTGYVEDSYHYGIDLGTNMYGVALSGFNIKGATFPVITPGIKLACVGTASGTTGYADGIILDHMHIQDCPVGVGVAYGDVPTGHIFGQSRFSEIAANGFGFSGGFSDWIDVGSIFTGNFYVAFNMGIAGTPGYNAGANRFIGTRFEENGIGLECTGCNTTHLEGAEFQFNHNYGFALNTGWSHFSMTGGFMQNNGQTNNSSFTASISGTTLTVTGSPSGIALNQSIFGSGVTAGTYITALGTGTGGAGTYTVNTSQTVSSEAMTSSNYADIGIIGVPNQGRLHLSNVLFPSISSATPDYILYSEVNPGDDYQIDGGDLFCTGNPGGAGKSFNKSMFNWVTGTAPPILNVRTSGCPQLITGRSDFSINASGAVGIGTASPTAGTAFDLGSNINSMLLPKGTTAQEPTAVEGMLRYNTTTHNVEAASGSSPAWSAVGGVTLPASNSIVVSAGTNTTTGIAPVNGDCLVASGGAWGAGACSGSVGTNLGTSASATSPQVTSDATTGFYTAATGKVDVAIGGVKEVEYSTSGQNITAGSLLLAGVNGLTFPASDSTTGGSISIGSGVLAGQTTSAAYSNTGIGYQALHGTMTTAAVSNTAIGSSALTADTSGHQNTAVGGSALAAATTGNQNTAIGVNACTNVTTGASDVCIGYNAGTGLHSSGQTVAIGYQAMQYGTGNYSLAFGSSALYQASGDSNMGLGNNAGSAITSGGNNVVLGANVGSSTLTTGSNNILIGTSNAVDTPASGTSNWLNIGNTLTGSVTAASGGNLSSCGTSPAIVGNDIKGTITEGGTATGCTFAFTTARANDPSCVITSQAGAAFSYAHSTAGFVITNVGALSGTKIDYQCFGN